jgi:hypothetical protein
VILYLSKLHAILQLLGQGEIVLEQFLDIQKDRRELLRREEARPQHRPMKLLEYDLQVSAVLEFSLHDLRDDLLPFRALLRTFPADERRIDHAAGRKCKPRMFTAL